MSFLCCWMDRGRERSMAFPVDGEEDRRLSQVGDEELIQQAELGVEVEEEREHVAGDEGDEGEQWHNRSLNRPRIRYRRRINYDSRIEEESRLRAAKAAIQSLKKVILSKPSWENEICDETIIEKYKREARDKGTAPEIIDEAIEQLKSEASYVRGNDDTSKASIVSSISTSTAKVNLAARSMKPLQGISQTQWENLLTSVAALQPKIPHMMEEYLEEKGVGVWHVDKVVPPQLRDILVTRLDAIANLPQKDFRPNRNNQVQDLINPSLFPYIENVSPILDKSTLPPKSYVPQWTRQYEDSKYQLLSSQVRVESNGSVKITSYINNLERDPNQDLYAAIELVFGVFLPMFEKLLPEKNLRERELQVIVKAANYVIPPNGAVYEGDWHVEGMSHEHIIASGIYYYSTSPWLKDGGLEFRRPRNEETDHPEIMRYSFQRTATHFEQNIPLGAVPTVEDRLIVLSNELQHKVSKLTNDSPDQVGTRKILVFFVVDPDIEIVSTKHIPEQQWERRVPGLLAVMSDVAFRVTGKTFPRETVHEIVSRACYGLTMVDARRHQLELMLDRKVKVDQDNENWERDYVLRDRFRHSCNLD